MSEISEQRQGARAKVGVDERRPVFVGDIQGCIDELEALLTHLEKCWGHDGFVLYAVGDLINRGPGNLAVLERLRALVEAKQATVVLGNHELHFLMVALGLRVLGERDTLADVIDSSECADWVDWIRRRPVAISDVLYGHPFVMVHASLHPNWDLDFVSAQASRIGNELGGSDLEITHRFLAQDPKIVEPDSNRDLLDRILSCRSVQGDNWSSAPPEKGWLPWHEAWSQNGHNYGIVYGHWAVQGLHVAGGLRGLDTGCVHHARTGEGCLTAWVPEPLSQEGDFQDPFSVPDGAFVQIPANSH